MNEEHQIYHDELRRQWNRLIVNNVVARTGYDTAAAYDESEEWKVRAACIALVTVNEKLMKKLDRHAGSSPAPAYGDLANQSQQMADLLTTTAFTLTQHIITQSMRLAEKDIEYKKEPSGFTSSRDVPLQWKYLLDAAKAMAANPLGHDNLRDLEVAIQRITDEGNNG